MRLRSSILGVLPAMANAGAITNESAASNAVPAELWFVRAELTTQAN